MRCWDPNSPNQTFCECTLWLSHQSFLLCFFFPKTYLNVFNIPTVLLYILTPGFLCSTSVPEWLQSHTVMVRVRLVGTSLNIPKPNSILIQTFYNSFVYFTIHVYEGVIPEPAFVLQKRIRRTPKAAFLARPSSNAKLNNKCMTPIKIN